MKKSKGIKRIRNLDKLPSRQIAKYEDSLEVLGLIRKGFSLNNAAKTVGITPSTVKKYVGSALKKKNKRIITKKNDSLLRKIRIYENGKEVFIQVKGNKKSRTIAQYINAVGRRTDKNEVNALETFQNKSIKDVFGKSHTFETNIENIIEILNKREEPEFFTIYAS